MYGWPGSWVDRYMVGYMGSETTNQYTDVRRLVRVRGVLDKRANTERQIKKHLDRCRDQPKHRRSEPVLPNVKYVKDSNRRLFKDI
jgi:hypothetical protein